MILVHLKGGKTLQLDPSKKSDLEHLDSSIIQSQIRRVSILSSTGNRVDLPVLYKEARVWLEILRKDSVLKGERVCMRTDTHLMKATLYYSDSRVVIDTF